MPPSIYSRSCKISATLLTEEKFRPFGTVAQSSPRSLANASPANQGTALKIPSVCPMVNEYHLAPSKVPAKASSSMFVCSPRALRQDDQALFEVNILERHPYTSQTFVPLGLDRSAGAATCYLVIVCASLKSPTTRYEAGKAPDAWPQGLKGRASSTASLLDRPPDLVSMKAFIAHGNQAVTYAAGTWHAPMVVLGKDAVEFVVFQFANGIGDEDCQEVNIVPEDQGGESIAVLIEGIPAGTHHGRVTAEKSRI